MNDSERDEILWRLDERTERMDAHVERIHDRVENQQEQISELDDRVDRHSMILGAMTFGLSAVFTAAVTKLSAITDFLRHI